MNHMCLLFSGPVRTLLGVLLCVGLCAAPAPAAQLAQDAPKRVLVLPFSVQTPNAPAHLQSGLASVLAVLGSMIPIHSPGFDLSFTNKGTGKTYEAYSTRSKVTIK